MTDFKHILVATDFGEAADAALALAIRLARPFASRLTLLHAYSVPLSDHGYGEMLQWPVDSYSRATDVAFRAAVRHAKGQYAAVEGALVTGDPWVKIVELARAGGAELIVMGTHGRRGLSHLLVGSVAEKVVRTSAIPVLVVPSIPAGVAREG